MKKDIMDAKGNLFTQVDDGRTEKPPVRVQRVVVPSPDCCAEWTRSGAALNFKARNYDRPTTEETGPPFRFCPWCGRARQNAEVSEGGTRDSRIETAAQSRPSLH